jgi:molybdopterin/thiamine biosynthesis adenylyltransferase
MNTKLKLGIIVLESGMDKHTNINSRSSGLVSNLNEYNFHILGCGAIGSAVALQLTRMGAFNFCLYDNDTVDIENVGVSQYTLHDVGHLKVNKLKSKILDINDQVEIMCDDKIFQNYIYLNNNDIIVLGFDSMKSRMDAVKALSKWKYSKPYALIDGRMGAEHYMQYALIKPNLSKYIPIWYTDDEGSEEPCNMKATSYCSNMSGSFISNCIRKIVTKQPYEEFISFHFPTMSIEKTTCISK